MIDFHFFNTRKVALKNNKDWLKKVVHCEEKKIGEVVYIFCTDDYLLEKNTLFLNKNELTDVIAFDYSMKNKISGDIFISLDRVKENATIFNEKFFTELDRVMVHGLLHLLGYRDKTKKEKDLMKIKEDFYLSIK